MAQEWRFTAELWEHEGSGAWHFVALPAEVADQIADMVADAAAGVAGGRAPGFGSVRVAVRVGASAWATSVFPDRARGTYLLPVKRAVRDAEGLVEGQPVEVRLRLAG